MSIDIGSAAVPGETLAALEKHTQARALIALFAEEVARDMHAMLPGFGLRR